MYQTWLVLLTFASLQIILSQKLKDRRPWYHTSDELSEELQALSSSCSDAKLTISTRKHRGEAGHQGAQLEIIHVSQGSSEGKQKAFFVFGEHARELISPESAMRLLHLLCGGGDADERKLVRRALENTVFVIVPNANPLGRKQVETGQYCQRTNENGVDLNRNWADNAIGSSRRSSVIGLDAEVNGGPHAFSEPETHMLRDILADEKPHVFLSVHSGAYLLGTPSAAGIPSNADGRNQQNAMDVLGRISQQFCDGDCPYGNLADVIGYSSPGCDIDYVSNQLQVPYAFTWEIYANTDIRQFFAEKAQAWAEGREMNDAAKTYFSMKSLMLLELGTTTHHWQSSRGHTKNLTSDSPDVSDNEECFEQFNPQTQRETEEVTAVWAKAFLTLCTELAPSSESQERHLSFL